MSMKGNATSQSMFKKKTAAIILFALLIGSAAFADEKDCKPLDDVIKYWKLNMHHPASESTVNKVCLQNRQALGLQQVEEQNRETNTEKQGNEAAVHENKQCTRKYLELVNTLCKETEQMLGQYHLDEARKAAKIPGEEATTEKHRQSARQYLGRAVVDEALPEMVTLKPRFRVYEFILKKGEQTSSWIQGDETATFIHVFETTNYAFEVRYKNGEVVKVWAGETVPKIPNGPFKIVATDDTEILIIVD